MSRVTYNFSLSWNLVISFSPLNKYEPISVLEEEKLAEHEFRNYSKAKIHKAQLLLNKQSDTFFLFQNLRPLKKYNQ